MSQGPRVAALCIALVALALATVRHEARDVHLNADVVSTQQSTMGLRGPMAAGITRRAPSATPAIDADPKANEYRAGAARAQDLQIGARRDKPERRVCPPVKH